jgi:SAM-dependent methyltransferase
MAEIRQCLCCGHEPVEPYLSLGDQPLANSYHHGEKALPTFPLGVALCPRCFHSQLTVSVDVHGMFDHYLYVSGTSRTLREYFRGFVEEVLADERHDRPPRVLEVGCNDGTLLGLFRDRGCEVWGVDPASNLRPLTEVRGLPVLDRYWDSALAGELGAEFDVVVAMNVLPHVPDPADFLLGCRRCLAPGGRIYVQMSQCDMFLNHEFDAIYHEHHSYFTSHSFKVLADRVGLRVASARKVAIHSRSLLFSLAPIPSMGESPPDSGWTSDPGDHDESFADLLAADLRNGLMDRRTYDRFARAAAETKHALASAVSALREAGTRLIGYGASAKGNVVLNYAGIDLEYIVDDNPLKWDYRTPGRNIPIRAPRVITAEAGPLAILCLAWNFREEISQKIRELRGAGRGDSMLLYVPQVRELAL